MNSTNLSTVIKAVAMQGVESSKPCELRYGEVVNDEPLMVKITDNFILPENLLIIPKEFQNKMESKTLLESYQDWENNTTEYTTTIQSFQSDNSLKIYDKVILIREQGGRKYIVIGRI